MSAAYALGKDAYIVLTIYPHLRCFFPGFGVFRDEVDAGARLVQLLRAVGVVIWRRRRRRNGRMIGRTADAVGDPARAARAAVDDEVRAATRRRPLLQSNGKHLIGIRPASTTANKYKWK